MTANARHCSTCGGELAEGRCASCASKAVSKIVRLDVARLFFLSAVAIFCIVGTRAVARLDEENDRQSAAFSYRNGIQALREGKQQSGIQYLRDATVHDRHEAKYALALGEALSA